MRFGPFKDFFKGAWVQCSSCDRVVMVLCRCVDSFDFGSGDFQGASSLFGRVASMKLCVATFPKAVKEVPHAGDDFSGPQGGREFFAGAALGVTNLDWEFPFSRHLSTEEHVPTN